MPQTEPCAGYRERMRGEGGQRCSRNLCPPRGVRHPKKHFPSPSQVSLQPGTVRCFPDYFFPPFLTIFNSIQHLQASAPRCFSREQPGKLAAAPGPAGPSSARGNEDKSSPCPLQLRSRLCKQGEMFIWAFSCKCHGPCGLGGRGGTNNMRFHPVGNGHWLPSLHRVNGSLLSYLFYILKIMLNPASHSLGIFLRFFCTQLQ